MAEGANVRQNLQNVPSIFEISAAETLDNLIYPALSKIFDYFGLRLDFTLWKSRHIGEELSPLATWLLQYLYLSKRGSSFGESFYGLQRTDTKSGNLLTKQKEVISATILTFMPYIERKLRTRSQHENISKWEEYVLKLCHAYKASKAAHTFLYLIKYASSHSLIFRTLNLTLRYPDEPPKDDKTTYIFLKLLEVLAFFLQFIQWWYTNDQGRKVGGTLENPEPMSETGTLNRSYTSPGCCPICHMNIENPTACSVSGVVYCWKCIATRLGQNVSSCPVTGYPITIGDLIRIYE